MILESEIKDAKTSKAREKRPGDKVGKNEQFLIRFANTL